MEEMGSVATRRVLDVLQKAEEGPCEVSPDLQLLPPSLVLRDSTSKPG
jgi:DNA-binding LacI/PurR family transcriptional regulator